MANLYLDRRGLELEWREGALLVRTPEGQSSSMPLALLENIVVASEIRCSSGLILRAAQAGCGVILLDRRQPADSVVLMGGRTTGARRRLAQMRVALDPAWRARWSRRLVETRMHLTVGLLREAELARPELSYQMKRSARRIEETLSRLHERNGIDPAALRGAEGAAAAAFFEAYRTLFAPVFGFESRNRRPPRDPVNACLSLGFTIAHSQAVRAIVISGLDPLIGFHHEPAPARESLACDLVETERSHVERWVWQTLRDRVIRKEHFGNLAGACLLGKTGRRIFYESFESLRIQSAARLERRCRRLARILDRQEFQ